MLSRVSTTFTRRSLAFSASRAASSTVGATASDALKFSGYSEIDFFINEESPTYDAVQRFAAFNIGCLVTTDAAGKLH
jgi:hypothetical protein